MPELRYGEAVNAALRRALETWPETLLYGEDVAKPGGVFGVTRRLERDFLARVFDTPISERAIMKPTIGPVRANFASAAAGTTKSSCIRTSALCSTKVSALACPLKPAIAQPAERAPIAPNTVLITCLPFAPSTCFTVKGL